MSTVLIVDDEVIHARAIGRFLDRRDHACEVVTSAAEARAAVARGTPDLVLLDIRLGDDDGLVVLQELRQLHPTLPVIMMTAYGSVETAVSAMKAGALDYVQKPIDLEELSLVVARALGEVRTREVVQRLQRSQTGWTREITLLGASDAMQAVHGFISRAARFEDLAAGDHPTVLLLGETGTGKGLLARVLHARSALALQPFIELDCTALPRDLIEAELFGHERGAFTDAKAAKAGLVEVASGGTLFLDEIAELSLDAQGKLLRLIEEKKVRRVGGLVDSHVDVRIVAATNRDLTALVEEKGFRKDLLYRLDVLTLTLPPLRERENDVVLLAEHYIGVYARKYGRSLKPLTPAARRALVSAPWVGNVRELSHAIERAMLLVAGDTIDAQDVVPSAPAPAAAASTMTLPTGGTLEQWEREIIRRVLEESSWNVSLAARRLGVTREVLRYRMRKYDLTAPETAR